MYTDEQNEVKLNYIYNWPQNKADAWSGTPLGLLNALQERSCIQNINIKPNIISRSELILNKVINKLTQTDDFNNLNLRIEEQEVMKNYNGESPALVFHEYITPNTSNMYLYIDCSVEYTVKLHEENPDLSKYTPYGIQKRGKSVESRVDRSNRFIKECQGIFTMSHWQCQILQKLHPELSHKFHAVGAGANIDVQKIGSADLKEGNKFLFVGKDWDRKNGELVFKAFRILKQEFEEIELYIVGPEEIDSSIKNYPGVHFIGFVKNSEIYNYYNKCDYFIMPSKFEAYGLVFGEALIYGLPCIGYDDYSMPEIIEDNYNGYLLGNMSEVELANLMKKMLKNQFRLKKTLIEDREMNIRRFSWGSVADKMIEIIKNNL